MHAPIGKECARVHIQIEQISGVYRKAKLVLSPPGCNVLCSTRQINTDLPVGRHFASPGHASTDVLVSVIHSGFRDTQNRRLFEAGMIFKHKTLHPGGLNTDFAFL